MEKIYVVVIAPSLYCMRYFCDPTIFLANYRLWSDGFRNMLYYGRKPGPLRWYWTTRFDEALQMNDLEFARQLSLAAKNKAEAMELTDELIERIDYINGVGGWNGKTSYIRHRRDPAIQPGRDQAQLPISFEAAASSRNRDIDLEW